MFTTLETLTPPGIKDRGFGEYIFGPFTIMSTAWGSYYINGNLNSDSRENLRFTSNFGNLQTAVYNGSSSTPIIEVTRFADGTKESVIAAGKGRWLYRGKFVYKVLSNNQVVLESREHDHGRFVAKAEVAYCDEFLDTWHVRDYLGSIRAVYDITETAVGHPIDAVLEQNDYYAFECRIETPDLPKMAANRYGYNGKERMYSQNISRWTTPDPMADSYYNTSPYAFCGNNPVIWWIRTARQSRPSGT